MNFLWLKASKLCYSTKVKTFHEIPTPTGLPFVGTLFSLIAAGGAEKLHEYIDQRHQQFGAIFKEQFGPVTSVFLNDPQEIRKVFANEGKYPKHVLPDCWLRYNEIKSFSRGLYFMDNGQWLQYRKILNRILLQKNYFEESMRNEYMVEHLYSSWSQNSRNGEVMELEKELYNLSLIFMLSFIFGNQFHKNASIFLPTVEKLAPIVKQIFEWSVQLSVIPIKLAESLNLRVWQNFVNSVDDSIKITSDLLADMNNCSPDCILHQLIEAKIPLDIIHSIIIDFILAAGDTTATASLWSFYVLGRHQNIQHQLFLEIENHNNRYWEISLLKNIVKETLRLYPVAPFITRYLPEPTKIASYLIEANQLISMSIYNCSRNEKYFPNSLDFVPNRWKRLENGKFSDVVDSYASLPFSLGIRSCIGKKLSLAQLYLTIGKMISLYQLEVKNEVDVKLNLITVPSEPIQLILKRRK